MRVDNTCFIHVLPVVRDVDYLHFLVAVILTKRLYIHVSIAHDVVLTKTGESDIEIGTRHA